MVEALVLAQQRALDTKASQRPLDGWIENGPHMNAHESGAQVFEL
jgi:hypothetical protein